MREGFKGFEEINSTVKKVLKRQHAIIYRR